VARLHHEHDERAPAPAERPPGTEKAQRMPHDAAEHHHWAGDSRALPRERSQQERHEVAALAVGAELDVRVRPRMDARADRHVVPGRARVVGERDGEDRLAVRSHQLTEAIAEQRERAGLPALDEQPVRAQRAGPSPPKYGSGTVRPGSPKNTPTGVRENVPATPKCSPTSLRSSWPPLANGTVC